MKYLLGELEIRNWKRWELERLRCIVDPEERRIYHVAIGVLDGVLND